MPELQGANKPEPSPWLAHSVSHTDPQLCQTAIQWKALWAACGSCYHGFEAPHKPCYHIVEETRSTSFNEVKRRHEATRSYVERSDVHDARDVSGS